MGRTLRFTGEDAEELTENLRDVVRRETLGDLDEDLMDVDVPQPSFWPLISEVEYRCNAEILRGVVLVDLPGIGDINAAREQVALDYLGRVDHIFIIAAAVRASDSNIFAGQLSARLRLTT